MKSGERDCGEGLAGEGNKGSLRGYSKYVGVASWVG